MINQLVFGYDEGHRLLAGSLKMSSKAITLLLGATDADPGPGAERLVTGVPLQEQRLYALCFTWSAPELPRPGAVWAHVLLIDEETMTEMEDPLGLAGFARRPTGLQLSDYERPLVGSSSPFRFEQPTLGLLERVVYAAYEPAASHIVISHNLSDGEAALRLLWGAQWPDLRMRFSFRTRDSVPTKISKADVTVARRVRGATDSLTQHSRPAWVNALAKPTLDRRSTPIVDFVMEFGRHDVPSPATVGELAALFGLVKKESVAKTRSALERRYPDQRSGGSLKLALFGEHTTEWWSASERTRVLTLVGAKQDAWNASQLGLVDRIKAVIGREGTDALSEAIAEPMVPSTRESMEAALVQVATAHQVAVVASKHRRLALEVLELRSDVAEATDLWGEVDPTAATWLLKRLSLISDAVLWAVIQAGRIDAAVKAAGAARTVDLLARSGSFQLAQSAIHRDDLREALEQSQDDRTLLLRATLLNRDQDMERLLAVLEVHRGTPDELWLRAAVSALSNPSIDATRVLRVVFGPLHSAITADRFPRECWLALDDLLPEAPDPALRLRRYLLQVARAGGWAADELAIALRDAGPYGTEILREFGQGDELWEVVASAVRRALGL